MVVALTDYDVSPGCIGAQPRPMYRQQINEHDLYIHDADILNTRQYSDSQHISAVVEVLIWLMEVEV